VRDFRFWCAYAVMIAPNAAVGAPFFIGGAPTGFYPLGAESGLERPPDQPPAGQTTLRRKPTGAACGAS